MDKKDYIIGVLSVCVIIGMLLFWAVPSYKQDVVDEVVFSVAQQQTNTGNIFYIANNTVAVVSIQEICQGG